MFLKILLDGPSEGLPWLAVGMLLVCCAIGCGSPGAPCSLSGQVTFDGKPIEDGNIRLDPIDGTPGPGGAAKIIDGEYAIPRNKGMLAGKHRVLISATRATGVMIRVETLGDGPSQREKIEQYIPDRYNANSELVLELVPGENAKEFDLHSD